MQTINELRNSNLKNYENDYIVDNLIRENGLYAILGSAKVGKSSFALQLANAVANGLNFLNLKTKKHPVLYLSTEMTPSDTISRIDLMNLNLNDNFFQFDFSSEMTIYLINDLVRDFIQKYNGKLVIIDMFIGIEFPQEYNINKYDDMSKIIIPQIRSLCNTYNVTVIITHHLNKNGQPLGSTAIESCMDGCLCLTKNKDLDDILYLNYIGRNYPSRKITLSRDKNMILSVNEDEKDNELNPNLLALLTYVIKNKEVESTISDLLVQLKIFIDPSVLGKLISRNKKLLESLGLYIEDKRTSDKRLYKFKYIEPDNLVDDSIFNQENLEDTNSFIAKEENNGY